MKFESANKKLSFNLLLLSVSLVFIDQFSKYSIRHFGGFYICNKGIAFGIKAQYAILWIFVISIVYFGCQILNSKFKILNELSNLKLKIENYPMILILSGAISNLIDRLYFGCVIDFIDLRFWPVFNLADSFIVIGSLILLAKYFKL